MKISMILGGVNVFVTVIPNTHPGVVCQHTCRIEPQTNPGKLRRDFQFSGWSPKKSPEFRAEALRQIASSEATDGMYGAQNSLEDYLSAFGKDADDYGGLAEAQASYDYCREAYEQLSAMGLDLEDDSLEGTCTIVSTQSFTL